MGAGKGAIPPRRRGRSEDRHERPDAPGRRKVRTDARGYRGHAPRGQGSPRDGRGLRLRVRRGRARLPGHRGGRRLLRVARRPGLPARRVLLQEGLRRAHPPGGPEREARGGDEGPQGDQRGGHGLLLRGGARALGRAPLRDAVLREPRARPLAQGSRPEPHGPDGTLAGGGPRAPRAPVGRFGRRTSSLGPYAGELGGAGTRRRTVVPFAGSERTSSPPFSSAVRSLIARIPTPSGVRPGSKPAPSSETSTRISSSVAPRATRTRRAPEWRLALARASLTTSSTSLHTSLGSSSGTPSETASSTRTPGERRRSIPTRSSTARASVRPTVSPARSSWMAWRTPWEARLSESITAPRFGRSPTSVSPRARNLWASHAW